MERLAETLNRLDVTWGGVLLALLLFVAISVGGIALVSFLLVKLPATCFCDGCQRDFWVERHPILRWIGRVLKNVLGVAAVFLGIMLSLPGIPGPGVLLILLGVTLVDFPGKRRLERWLVSRPKVLNTINRLRQLYGKPPLVLEELVEGPRYDKCFLRHLTRREESNMLPIKTILHPTDFSEHSGHAFELAGALAGDYGARWSSCMSPRHRKSSARLSWFPYFGTIRRS